MPDSDYLRFTDRGLLLLMLSLRTRRQPLKRLAAKDGWRLRGTDASQLRGTIELRIAADTWVILQAELPTNRVLLDTGDFWRLRATEDATR